MSLRDLRRAAKKQTKPNPATLERFRQGFLMSAHPENRDRFAVTFQDALNTGKSELSKLT